MREVLVIIPAYNEEKNIRSLLKNLKQSDVLTYADVVVINDGSKDGTKQVVREEGFLVINQLYNMGYGAALQTGYKYAVEKQYKYLIQIDADGQHDVCNIGRIYQHFLDATEGEKPDIIIGSRYLDGGVSFEMSGIRLFAVKMFRRIIRIVCKINITDPTSGLQGLSKSAFEFYAGFSNFDIHYPDINMIIQMLLIGHKVEEIPAVMYKRVEGKAMHSGIIKPIKYMVVMMISTLNAIIRYYKKMRDTL